MSGVQALTWYRRLFFEAGLLDAVPQPISLLEGTGASVAATARGFSLLQALRADLEMVGTGTPFERRFAAAWCGISERTARDGINELLRQGALVVVEWQGRLRLFDTSDGGRT